MYGLLYPALGIDPAFPIGIIGNKLIEIILQRSFDLNRVSPFYSEDGSAWGLFLRTWARQPWVLDFESDTTRSLSSQRVPEYFRRIQGLGHR